MAKKRAAAKVPVHLTPGLKEIWKEIVPTLYVDTPPAVVDAICTQVKTMRDARALIEKDGVVVTDGKNNAVEHPAIAIEQKTLKHISDLNKVWAISD